jgi:very-short-patch-repair endonuclease
MHARPKTRVKAKRLRADLSPPELRLWQALRRDAHGLHFRNQHGMGQYVLDFYCHGARLCVEVDGWHHLHRQAADAARDQWLANRGILTWRIPAAAVFQDLDGVLEGIHRVAHERRGTLDYRRSLLRCWTPSP